MKNRFLYLFFLLASFETIAQQDRSTFFNQQTVEYNEWLKNSKLALFLKLHTQSFQNKGETFELVLKSEYNRVDSLASAWQNLDDSLVTIIQKPLANLLFNEGAFLFDLMPNQFTIKIIGKSNEAFRTIYFSKNEIQDKMHLGIAMGAIPIRISIQELRLPAFNRKIVLSNKILVRAVTQSLANYVKRYFQSKPSSWLYAVSVDTNQTFFNSFTYRITCLKNEIIQANYFEFIELSIEVIQQNDQTIEVRLDIRGKYCGGLLCPKQQEKFYYSMEGSKYDSDLKTYTDIMARRINQWLNK